MGDGRWRAEGGGALGQWLTSGNGVGQGRRGVARINNEEVFPMRVINESEAGRLLAAISTDDIFGPRDRAMLMLVLHTGLRVAELCGLDIHHVALDGQPRQALHLPSALAKGGHERTIPLNDVARRAVAAILGFNARYGFSTAPTAPLLVTRKHQRITVRSVQRLVAQLRERAGLDVPATPHSFRHCFATELMRASSNLRIVQKALGHKRLQVTQVYTHPTNDDLAAAVAALAPLPQPAAACP